MTEYEMREAQSRRDFLGRLAGGTAVLGAWSAAHASPQVPAAGRPLCIFSKHLQWLDYAEMGRRAAELGFDGVDLTVRPGGHVAPERVRQDLPRAVEGVQKAGLQVHMITTAVTDPADPATHAILETAAQQGIRYYRPGYFRYRAGEPLSRQLDHLKTSFRRLAEVSQTYGIYAGYQNHAGTDYVGAPLWDLWHSMRDLDPNWIGCQFDIRHAAVEGATTWPVSFRLLAPHTRMLAIKDFRWQPADGGKARVLNCPLGEGQVDFPGFLKMAWEAGFAGPVSVHYEYPLGGAESGRTQLSIPEGQVRAAMRADLDKLRQWMKQAGL